MKEVVKSMMVAAIMLMPIIFHDDKMSNISTTANWLPPLNSSIFHPGHFKGPYHFSQLGCFGINMYRSFCYYKPLKLTYYT